jgi:hypothetical protein
VNPCSDFGFKRAFKDPQVASGFLNTILSLEGEDIISHLEYADQELSSCSPEGRDFRVDVLCRTKKGEWFLLEMQNDYREDYPDKALVEFCRLLGNMDVMHYQVCSNPSAHAATYESEGAAATPPKKRLRMDPYFWKSIPKVITLVITNKEFSETKRKERFPDQFLKEPDIINEYTLRHTRVSERRLGNIDARIVLVMLANFTKAEETLSTDMDRWLFALKDEHLRTGHRRMDMYKHVSSLAAVEGDNPSLKRFYHLLNKEAIEAQQLRPYEENMQFVDSIMEARYAEGREAGVTEGRAAGMAEGREAGVTEGRVAGVTEGLLQAARAMKALGTMTNAQIAGACSLEEDVVAGL